MLFITSWCPHCRKARVYIDQLFEEKPAYKDIPLRIIDEEKEKAFADQFDYYRVPTFYVDGKKVHEGVPSLEGVRHVFELALQ
jgi:glutaredoxin